LFLALAAMVLGRIGVVSIIASAVAMAAITFVSWRSLDEDVRSRAWHLLGRDRPRA
jgi:hypothetical protein